MFLVWCEDLEMIQRWPGWQIADWEVAWGDAPDDLVSCFLYLPDLSPEAKTEVIYVFEIGRIHCKEWSSWYFKAS